MGMSTHVVGFVPPDAKWKQMKQVWDACEAGGVKIPDEVQKFFNYETPDENGVEIRESDLEKCGAVTEWGDDGRAGYEIHIDKLPTDVKIVRVYNSW